MEDNAKMQCGSDRNPGANQDGPTKGPRAWVVVFLVGLALLIFLTLPFLTRRGEEMGSGSYTHARQWRTQLLACQSLDDVKQQFNCIEYMPAGGGSARRFRVTDDEPGRPQALIGSFPDGKWIACAYGDSHGGPGGGTVVSRDSDGAVHVFFGHVCGRPHAWGDTPEEFYAGLRRNNHIEEQPLRKLK